MENPRAQALEVLGVLMSLMTVSLLQYSLSHFFSAFDIDTSIDAEFWRIVERKAKHFYILTTPIFLFTHGLPSRTFLKIKKKNKKKKRTWHVQ